MKKQYVWAMVATLGLVGCGGGGGGGSDDPGATTGVTAAKLVGTWVQTNEIYSESTPGNRVWFRTARQTIIVEQSGSGLRFTNCVSGTYLNSGLSNNVASFPVQSGVAESFELEVVNASTITGTVSLSGTNEADVVLRKVSSDTTIESAQANLTVDVETLLPFTRSSWNQLCVETRVQAGDYFAELKASTTVLGNPATVSMKFSSATAFVTDDFDYPGAALAVSGTFDAPNLGVSGDLFNPSSGSIALAMGSESVDFDITDLIMPSDLGLDVEIDGTISLDPEWLALPEAE